MAKKDFAGGIAANKSPQDFDQDALAEGAKVEMEHTDDPKVAQRIAMDHLSEDPKYYQKLKIVEGMKKAEAAFADLLKVDPTLKQHLANIRRVAPDSARVIANRLYVDTLVPGSGNRAAYEDFLSRPRAGVHVMIDGNDLSAANKVFGQSAGDEAIRAMGGALRKASRVWKGKMFHISGDEFGHHFDTPEHAYGFVRQARKELEALTPLRGVYKHSVSIGLGHSPTHAEQALIHAKNAKKSMNYPVGQAQTHVHSLLEGSKGPVASGAPMPPPGFIVSPEK